MNPTQSPQWQELPSAGAMRVFGQRMRARRVELHWSLMDMARAMTAATGGRVRVTAPTLRTYETAERSPFLPMALFVADVLGVRLGELVGEEVSDRGDRLATNLSQLLLDYLNAENGAPVATERATS